jgi:hypothetical protein
VVDPDRATAGLQRPAEEDATATADVEQVIVGGQPQRLEHGLPGERVHVVRAVDLPRAAATRTPSHAIRHSIDPPLTHAAEQPHLPSALA